MLTEKSKTLENVFDPQVGVAKEILSTPGLELLINQQEIQIFYQCFYWIIHFQNIIFAITVINVMYQIQSNQRTIPYWKNLMIDDFF